MATDTPTDIDRLQASVASLASAFTVPYGQLLRSLDNSNKMVEHLNGLLERFVLQAVSVRVRFFPLDDDAVQALFDCSNLSDLTIEHITLTVDTAMHVTGEAGATFTLGPLASNSVRLTLRGLRRDHQGSADVTLPSPGTQATLRKAVPWSVPLSLRCRRQLRIGTAASTAVADARHSAVVSASVVRSLFGLDASAVLPTGAGAEYAFTLPDGTTHISAFVDKAFDHKNLVVVSPQENSSELLQDLQQSALS